MKTGSFNAPSCVRYNLLPFGILHFQKNQKKIPSDNKKSSKGTFGTGNGGVLKYRYARIVAARCFFSIATANQYYERALIAKKVVFTFQSNHVLFLNRQNIDKECEE